MNDYEATAEGLSTRCVHAGEVLDAKGAIHAPLYNRSTFGFASTQEVLDVVEGRVERSLYTRYGLNPTIRSVERKLADPWDRDDLPARKREARSSGRRRCLSRSGCGGRTWAK